MKASMVFRVSGLGLGGLSKQVIASVFRTLLKPQNNPSYPGG